MDKEEVKTQLRDQVERARLALTLVNSQGWTLIFEPILKKHYAELRDVKNAGTLKELEANKRAIKILDDIVLELKQVIKEAENAQESLERLSEIGNITFEIEERLQEEI